MRAVWFFSDISTTLLEWSESSYFDLFSQIHKSLEVEPYDIWFNPPPSPIHVDSSNKVMSHSVKLDGASIPTADRIWTSQT